MVNTPLIRPYFFRRGGIGGTPLESHDTWMILEVDYQFFVELGCTCSKETLLEIKNWH